MNSLMNAGEQTGSYVAGRYVAGRTVPVRTYGTFSVSVGSEACNAGCPYCSASMTPPVGPVEQRFKLGEVGRMLECMGKAAQFARSAGIKTVLITGKGEPTLAPAEISLVLQQLKPYQFPIAELQTNGLLLGTNWDEYGYWLGQWQALGLVTVAISVVHHEFEPNRRIYTEKGEYMDLLALIRRLKRVGMRVRLSLVLLKDFIDSVEGVDDMISFAKEHGVDQLTIRPVGAPEISRNDKVAAWTREHPISPDTVQEIYGYLHDIGKPLDELPHGATVFDVDGQNVCFTNCLTHDPTGSYVRQVILFLRAAEFGYSWEYLAARYF